MTQIESIESRAGLLARQRRKKFRNEVRRITLTIVGVTMIASAVRDHDLWFFGAGGMMIGLAESTR